MNKNPGWLGYIGDEILPNYIYIYIGIILSHYKDPYKPTSIMESNKVFFRGSPKHLKKHVLLEHPNTWDDFSSNDSFEKRHLSSFSFMNY